MMRGGGRAVSSSRGRAVAPATKSAGALAPIRTACSHAWYVCRHASAAQSKHKVLPVPVGDSSNALPP
jgi:hypothetical protein